MSDKLFLVTKTHIVKAKNMKHARSIIEGDEDIPGDLLVDNIFAKEVDEEQASHYFSTGQNSFYDTVDEIDEDKNQKLKFLLNDLEKSDEEDCQSCKI